jgi:hypothetical protein
MRRKLLAGSLLCTQEPVVISIILEKGTVFLQEEEEEEEEEVLRWPGQCIIRPRSLQ